MFYCLVNSTQLTLNSEVDFAGGQVSGCAWVGSGDGCLCDHAPWSGCDGGGSGDDGGGGDGGAGLAAGGGGGGEDEVLRALDDVHAAVAVTLDKLGAVARVGEVHGVVGVVDARVRYVLEGV